MGNSKIQLGTGETLIDLTNDTVTAATLLSGVTAHDKSGTIITGQLDITPKICWGLTSIEGESPVSNYTFGPVVDANGNEFEPNGFAIILREAQTSSGVIVSYDTPGMLAMVSTHNATSITTNYPQARLCFTNALTSPKQITQNSAPGAGNNSIQYGSGYFTYRNTGVNYYLYPGNWMWVAWRT